MGYTFAIPMDLAGVNDTITNVQKEKAPEVKIIFTADYSVNSN